MVAKFAADKLGAPNAERMVMPWKSFPECKVVLLGNDSSNWAVPAAE